MQDICVTATRDHNVYASFRPSIATKDAETRSKMNTVKACLDISSINYMIQNWLASLPGGDIKIFKTRKNQFYYPTALKGCRGIVFTHDVQMGGRAGWRAAGKSLSGLYLRNCKV